jgi:hypothetical protein
MMLMIALARKVPAILNTTGIVLGLAGGESRDGNLAFIISRAFQLPELSPRLAHRLL